ncbi:methyl-accepting chemotaxis sensory transducer with TarH sensor [Paracidovorax anthurii]|uniref:Methyl-accepting chemotaxis sensory transducer with TarH sensor n=1 Tax=Paracidovorax anthurii TaxID=78229 RepID=A0A328ZGK1_9BURK|nr:methyl-accepting chemotaxis protein [Paracidovorax anthurii]RAR84323.1 methyl-accepting chemotaxis sensory transducer with TarH sensor [Paracidovorax anthurii]
MIRSFSIRSGLFLVLAFFTAALLVAVAVGWMGIRSGVSASESQARVSKDMLALKQAEIRMWDNRVALAVAHRNMLRGDAPPSIRSQTDRADKAMQDAAQILQSVAQGMSAQDRPLADSVLTAFKAYDVLVRRGSAGLAGGNVEEYSGKEIVDQRNRLLAEMDGLMQKLFQAADQRGQGLHDDTVRMLRTSEIVAGFLVATGLLLAIGCWLFIRRQVLAPLDEAGVLLERVAQGDLTSRIEVRSGNEIGRLLLAARTMQEGLVRMVSQVRQGVEEIRVGAQEIARGNSDLSGRTEQQAASLEETAASMEELSSTVKHNADSAKLASQLATGSMEVARRGGSAVDEVVVTMQAISESSHKIADIVNVIDGIAFQTNILALNAAVEAARAGEQGKGFAVVASEVRALAQRSAEAAKEIKALIADSVGKVGAGSSQVERAGSTMQEIVASVERVTDIMGEISAASREQSSGIDQVNQAVVQMDQATQQNAALVEQAAAAAASLEEQTQRLQSAVAQFRVAAGDVPRGGPAPVAKPRPAGAAPRPVARPMPAPARPAVAAPAPVRAPAPRKAPALGRSAAPPPAPAASTPPPSGAAKPPAARPDDEWESF